MPTSHSPGSFICSPPFGSIVAPVPRYAAFYNNFESWCLGFTDMELESNAQLLNALSSSIPTASGAELYAWNGCSRRTESD